MSAGDQERLITVSLTPCTSMTLYCKPVGMGCIGMVFARGDPSTSCGMAGSSDGVIPMMFGQFGPDKAGPLAAIVEGFMMTTKH